MTESEKSAKNSRSGGDESWEIPDPRPVQYFCSDSGKALNHKMLESMEGLAKKSRKVPASQLRRFYADVTAFERKLTLDKELPDSAVLAQMALLRAKAVYARARLKKDNKRDEKYPTELLQFFIDHANAVQSKEDYFAFHRVFETLVAYHKFYEEKKGE